MLIEQGEEVLLQIAQEKIMVVVSHMFLFSPLKLGEDSHFDDHIFSDGVVQHNHQLESMGKVKTHDPSCLGN